MIAPLAAVVSRVKSLVRLQLTASLASALTAHCIQAKARHAECLIKERHNWLAVAASLFGVDACQKIEEYRKPTSEDLYHPSPRSCLSRQFRLFFTT